MARTIVLTPRVKNAWNEAVANWKDNFQQLEKSDSIKEPSNRERLTRVGSFVLRLVNLFFTVPALFLIKSGDKRRGIVSSAQTSFRAIFPGIDRSPIIDQFLSFLMRTASVMIIFALKDAFTRSYQEWMSGIKFRISDWAFVDETEGPNVSVAITGLLRFSRESKEVSFPMQASWTPSLSAARCLGFMALVNTLDRGASSVFHLRDTIYSKVRPLLLPYFPEEYEFQVTRELYNKGDSVELRLALATDIAFGLEHISTMFEEKKEQTASKKEFRALYRSFVPFAIYGEGDTSVPTKSIFTNLTIPA